MPEDRAVLGGPRRTTCRHPVAVSLLAAGPTVDRDQPGRFTGRRRPSPEGPGERHRVELG